MGVSSSDSFDGTGIAEETSFVAASIQRVLSTTEINYFTLGLRGDSLILPLTVMLLISGQQSIEGLGWGEESKGV